MMMNIVIGLILGLAIGILIVVGALSFEDWWVNNHD